MRPIPEYDVVIIGGGIAGLASAWFLARAGRRALVIERGGIAGEASGRNGGHVSPSTYDPAQRELGYLALRLWPQLAGELDREQPTEYQQSGSLAVRMAGDPPRAVESHADDPAEALSLAETRRLLPGVAPDIAGGVFRPRRGQAHPVRTTRAIAAAAQRLGATIWERTSVTGVLTRGGAVRGVATTRGAVAAPWVVNCAGGWAASVGAMVGLRIPVIPDRLQILLSEPVAPLTAAVWSGHNIYARQALSGHLHFGLLSRYDRDARTDCYDARLTPLVVRDTARQMAELLPGSAATPLLRGWAGINATTPDGAPIVDAPPAVKGFVIAAGFWNGFGLGLATGKVVSELIVAGRASVDISGLALRRFDAVAPGGRAAESDGEARRRS